MSQANSSRGGVGLGRERIRKDRRCSAATLAILLWLSGGRPTWGQPNASVEYQLKAAFLFNFAKFVEWPAETFQGEQSPITFCVFRHDPFGSALDGIIAGKTIYNRQLLARRVNEVSGLKFCQIVFVDGREDKLLPEILRALKGSRVLVVGESENFASHGGDVQFFLENDRLRFAINVDAVQRGGLKVSSKLLALAHIMHDGDGQKGI